MRALEIGFGWLLDLLLGDPEPHPVSGLGRIIAWADARLPRTRSAGALLVLVVAGGTWALSWGLVALAARADPLLGALASGILFFAATALRTLDREARATASALAAGDLDAARRRVGRLVGRDTGGLDEAGLARAAVEAVAESSVDAVTAPLLFAALGGGPLAMAYRAVNTMDSMVGHRDERYRRFGWAAARLDDVLNWVPARATGLLLVLAAGLVGEDARGAWRILARDRLRHDSPNAGHPEAAVAGALGLRLGGPASYGGERVVKPWLGDGGGEAGAVHVLRAMRLVHVAALMALGMAMAGTFSWDPLPRYATMICMEDMP